MVLAQSIIQCEDIQRTVQNRNQQSKDTLKKMRERPTVRKVKVRKGKRGKKDAHVDRKHPKSDKHLDELAQ